jgi:3-hydroxyacyl-[acyl-carrier-protein] dehydratase
MLSHHDIKRLLPHRHPMLLVDAVREIHLGSHIVAVKNITGNEPCYAGLDDGAGPGSLAYPCTLIIESFCQAAGVLCSKMQQEAGSRFEGLILFGAISRFRFYDDALPGDTLEHRVRLEKVLANAGTFSGEVWARGRKIAQVERVVFAIRSAEALAGAEVVAVG